MKTMKKLIAMTSVMALFAGQVQGQCPEVETSCAYEDCNDASNMSALWPIGAFIGIAAAIILLTDHHHHHHHHTTTGTTHAH